MHTRIPQSLTGEDIGPGLARRRTPAIFASVLAAMIMASGDAFGQQGDLPSAEEMWRIIQQQQQEIEALKARMGEREAQTAEKEPAAATTAQGTSVEALEQRVAATEEMLEATAVALEQQAAGAGEGWWNRTTIGGYGELHYNGGEKDEIDFHRFVLFAGHRFNDWIRFQSELEVEHADTEKNGAVELEQAFVEFDLSEGAGLSFGDSDRHFARAGVFLVPVGILNETHEPPTFFGVERNSVEANIIPTTWREAGFGLYGDIAYGFGYDVAIHSGLEVPLEGSNAFKIRNGRKSVSEAPADSPAVTARLRWSGLPGVRLAVSGQYQGDVTQDELNVDATLLEANADIRQGPFGLRALYARWDLNGPEPKLLGRDEQTGWYVEPSYRINTGVGEIGVFGRYLQWDNEGGDDLASKFKQTFIGVNYWPHPNVVVKMDYQFDNPPAGKEDDDRVNLGVGYQF